MNSCRREIRSTALVVAALVLASVPAGAQAGWGLVRTIGTGTDEVTVLYVAGTPYQMGWWHGNLLQAKVQANVASILGSPDFAPITEEQWDTVIALMWPHVPAEYDQEIHGLADGSAVAYRDLQKMHVAPDISEYHCSNFCAFGTATAGARMIQMRILDWSMDTGIQDNPVITVYHPQGGIRHAAVGFAGFAGSVTGINEHHVAIGEMGDSFGWEHETLDGEPLVFLMREVLARAHSYAEAYSIMQAAQRTSSLWYVIGESTSPNAGIFRTAMDIFEVWGPGQPVGSYPAVADCVYGGHYMDKLYNDLTTHFGAIDPGVAQQIVLNNAIPGDNLLDVIYDVTTLQLWAAYAEGPNDAKDQGFVPFDFRRRIHTFDDVTPASSQWPYVEALVRAKMTGGCSGAPPLFCPAANVTRAQMAKFLCIAAGKQPLDPAAPTFGDVPKVHWAYGYVERLADAASWGGTPPTGGCGAAGTTRYFCPNDPVTREQMAKLLCLAAGESPMPSCSGVFADVWSGSWACPCIERLTDAPSWPGSVAVTSGCVCPPGYLPGAKCYCPKSPVTRGQMAVFLVRAFGIPL